MVNLEKETFLLLLLCKRGSSEWILEEISLLKENQALE